MMKTSPSKLVLVDADGLLYIAGAIGETRYYDVTVEDSSGELKSFHKDSAADVKEWLAEHKDHTLVEKELVTIPGPLDHCLQVAKQKLKEIQKRYGKQLEVYVKGDGTNWRDDIATVVPYKANRTAPKPYWLEDVRQYLIHTWGAIEISGKEADDQIATRAYEASKEYVVCSPDKDLDQIPGTHWNYKKSVEYEISSYEAQFFFWQQVLSGDPADNIKGCWKVGEGKAMAFIEERADLVGGDEALLWQDIVETYEESKELPGCPYADRQAEEVALENARLVWMQTEHGRLWTPPGAALEYVEEMSIEF